MKQYNIIPLNGFLYAVEKGIRSGATVSIQEWNGVMTIWDDFEPYAIIIGSNDPSLKDIPQLPEIEENIIAALAKVGLDNPTAGEVYAYKAASKNKYSEEDILEAIRKARMERYDSLEKKVVGFSYTKKEILESLTKQPTAIEVEMEVDADDKRNWYEDVPSGKYWEDEPIPPSKDRLYTNAKYLKPKVDKDNRLIVKKWIYE